VSSVLERMERQAVVLDRDRMLSDVDRAVDLDWLMEFEQLQWRDKVRAMRYQGDPMASFVTGTSAEILYNSLAAGASAATFTAETNLNTTATMGVGAKLGADFFIADPSQLGRAIKITAQYVIGTTGTPTFTFTIRMGSTQGAVTGTIALGSAAVTTISAAAARGAFADGYVTLTAIGAAGANSTIRGIGTVSGAALAATGDLFGGAASPGTVATFDTSVTNFINVNAACGTSNAANTIQLLQLMVWGLN
jgi:hypothetical protein